eukprot:750196-Hanusia_phi.AAC.3
MGIRRNQVEKNKQQVRVPHRHLVNPSPALSPVSCSLLLSPSPLLSSPPLLLTFQSLALSIYLSISLPSSLRFPCPLARPVGDFYGLAYVGDYPVGLFPIQYPLCDYVLGSTCGYGVGTGNEGTRVRRALAR